MQYTCNTIFRQYKQKAAEESKRKKRLKVDSWEIVDEKADEEDVLDIRDIEFHMTNDAQRIHALISGASASSGRDLVMLKVSVIINWLLPIKSGLCDPDLSNILLKSFMKFSSFPQFSVGFPRVVPVPFGILE